jgi:hypothetical protein
MRCVVAFLAVVMIARSANSGFSEPIAGSKSSLGGFFGGSGTVGRFTLGISSQIVGE